MKTPIQWFEELTAIPRASGEEERVCDYLEAFARERGLAFRRDALHNAVIKKPAYPGACGDAVMLQAHTDIVPVKEEGVVHDFSTDPVALVKEGDVWRADGTTLGADNGLGISMILGLLDDPDAAHPALECVFTTQEETGMYGADALDVQDLSATRLINLDCGGEGCFTTSCAGGLRARVALDVKRQSAQGSAYKLEVSGLNGGHSGGEIHTGRANAIKLLARAIDRLEDALLADISGGDRDNVIPSYAGATIYCACDPTDAVREVERGFKAEFAIAEPNLRLTIEPCRDAAEPLTKAASATAVRLLLAIPYGVRALVPGQRELVETSANVGSISLVEDTMRVNLSIRSSNNQSKRVVVQELQAICLLAGADMTTEGDYPGWAYDPNSKLRAAAAKVYKEHSGKEGEFFGIHAGLECGLFMSKLPGLDAIAMGANSGGAHTTKEWMSVSSLESTYRFLRALLGELAQG